MKSKLEKMKKQKENPLTRITYRVVSQKLTPLISKTSITPNQVSLMSVITALISGVFFALSTYQYLVLAFVFLQLTILLDAIDGDLARYTNKCTIIGSWIDSVVNNVHKFFFLLGASVGVFRTTNDAVYLILGSIVIFSWSFSVYLSESSKKLFKSKKSLPSIITKSRGSYFPVFLLSLNLLGLSALINKVGYALWFFSVVGLIWTVIKTCSIYKKGKKVESDEKQK